MRHMGGLNVKINDKKCLKHPLRGHLRMMEKCKQVVMFKGICLHFYEFKIINPLIELA